jgi:hypothetical protein
VKLPQRFFLVIERDDNGEVHSLLLTLLLSLLLALLLALSGLGAGPVLGRTGGLLWVRHRLTLPGCLGGAWLIGNHGLVSGSNLLISALKINALTIGT